MAQDKPFKVVIVGGSIAGLSLANMLQANNIDYVVLEAYPDIAPQVGASIGLLPHGNRILDQLGMFDRLMTLSTPVDNFTFRNDSGNPIAACHDVNHSFTQRHGFPIIFLDRQTVLQVLYDNIRDKSKVLPGNRVTNVVVTDHDATAITAEGLRYTGDMVVGADGVHSSVRDEMWKLASKLKPGLVRTAEAQEVMCDYTCIFGISKSCPGVKPGDMNSVFRDKASYLVIGGSQGRTYWFRFQKFPKRLYGSEIPRYTPEDVDRAVDSFRHEHILPGVQMSELIKNKVSVSMTPLVEHVYSKWHFGRVTTVGDSCHKFHPIGGHGGNAAIETGAALTNLLVEKLGSSSTGHLTTGQIDDIFGRVQELRHKRTVDILKYSHNQQRTESLDDAFKKFSALNLLPLIDNEDVTFNFSCQIPAGEKLNMLSVRRGERLIPFKDELLRDPKSRGPYQWLLISFYVILAAVVYYGMWILPESWGLMPLIEQVLADGKFEQDPSFKLRTSYTGLSGLDQYLTFLAVIFMPGLRGWNPSFRMFQVYFLGLIAQPICIWTVESCRKRNVLTLLSVPTLWFILFQSTGIGFFMPLYYAVYTNISDLEPYWWPLRRAVPIQYAKVLLPACLIGYFLPTVLMFIPWSDSEAAQIWETFWQPSPAYVPLLTMVFGALYRWYRPLSAKEKRSPRAKDEPADLTLLKRLYVVIGVLGVLVHWYVLLSLVNHDTLSFTGVFFPNYSMSPMPLDQAFLNIFSVDFWGFVVASYVWCVCTTWDLKRVGRAEVDIVQASLVILIAHLALGPGAAMSAVWYWREDKMAVCFFPAARKEHKE